MCLECFPAICLLVVSLLAFMLFFVALNYPPPPSAAMAVGFCHNTTTLFGGCGCPYSNTMCVLSNGLMGIKCKSIHILQIHVTLIHLGLFYFILFYFLILFYFIN